jgi:hypothetical protein
VGRTAPEVSRDREPQRIGGAALVEWMMPRKMIREKGQDGRAAKKADGRRRERVEADLRR